MANSNNIITLYHGSRSCFDRFETLYRRTGEGVGDYDGWYFCSTPKGALRHCERYLRCSIHENEGYVLECAIEAKYVDSDVDGIYTEPCYGGPVSGVRLFNSSKIKIVKVIGAREVFESVYGKIVEHANL